MKIKVIKQFRDLRHGKILRKPEFEYNEEDARAKQLVELGYVVLVPEEAKTDEVVETAVKEEKKEKAVIEKVTTASKKKVTMRNAKK